MKDIKGFEHLNAEAAKWVAKLKGKKDIPLDLLKEGLKMKNEAMKYIDELKESDPSLASVVKSIEANSDKLHDEILELVYKGEMSIDELKNLDINVQKKTVSLSKVGEDISANAKCLACTACTACATCAFCGFCFITGVAAAAITSSISSVSATGSYGS